MLKRLMWLLGTVVVLAIAVFGVAFLLYGVLGDGSAGVSSGASHRARGRPTPTYVLVRIGKHHHVTINGMLPRDRVIFLSSAGRYEVQIDDQPPFLYTPDPYSPNVLPAAPTVVEERTQP